jgi:hypothetical protein
VKAFYEDRIRASDSRISVIRRRLNQVVLFRFLAFSAILASGWFLLRGFTVALLLAAILSTIVFIALVRVYFSLKDSLAYWKKMRELNANEAGVLENKPNMFPDGEALLDSETYLDDLDIFGQASLYHLLNRTTTSHGSEALAYRLRNSLRSPEKVGAAQQAVQVLSGQTELRQRITVQGLLAGEKEGNLHSLQSWLISGPRLHNHAWIRLARWTLICYNLAALYLLAETGRYFFLLAGIGASWGLLSLYAVYIKNQHLLISRKQAVLEQYAAILSAFNSVQTDNSTLLQELQARSDQAHRAVRHLSRLAAFFDQRLNAVVNVLLNSFFLYDLFCIMALEKWKAAHAPSFGEWIDAVGNIECLNSLATFAYNNPAYVYPTPLPVTGRETLAAAPSASGTLHGLRPFLEATGMAHPLIPAAERVSNDLRIGADECLILVTGSNMSGKTTFLRTTGVNLLLAQTGAPVCALSFSFTPLQILTSLRISDSLQEHTSYFMAELKKLRKIICSLENGVPALVLVDEILRGTNSEDKTYGSEQFIRKLINYPCLTLFATHDLTLGRLEEEKRGLISNYCFESIISGDELLFPYKLERGIARNRNASFLMKKMDII